MQRDRHAELVSACAIAGGGLERIATEIRSLQRTEILEAEEPFAEGQKGSSAMPHKRNPWLCEQVTGLARVLRAHAGAALEDIALWHERDISHSSVERIVLPDATILLDYLLGQTVRILDGLRVYPERMRENLDRSYGLVYSQRVLLALTEAGLARQAAYEVVQRNAMRAWEERRAFLECLEADPEVRASPRPGAPEGLLRSRLVPAPRRRGVPEGRARPGRIDGGMKARIVVRLRPGILDPQGTTIQRALEGLGFPEVRDMRVGKVIDLTLDETDAGAGTSSGWTRCAGSSWRTP